MRRINSDFQTLHISEEGQKLSNRDYFGYVEMDDFACYVLADSLDDEPAVNSARLVVDSIIRDFTEAPTMGKGTLRRYLLRAHTELLKQRAGMHLKVAVVVAVTDYRTLRYCHVGNSRLYLIRNARILEQTKDQSLTQNLLEQERILLDEAARHEERNNLYSFLGERGKPEIQISRKKKLEAGDLLIQLTRGVWEQCGEQELLRIVNDAKETKDILDQVEDCILMEQNSRSIDNYSMAVTAVNKVYQSPKKPVSVKKVLMIVLPVLLVVITVGVTLFLRYRNIQNKTQSLLQYMESGEEYLACSNFQKVAEEYEAAKKLADSLPAGSTWAWSGISLQEKLASGQAMSLYAISILVVFLCLAALYESWSVPFSVIMVIPLGLLGAALAATLRGLSNDVYFQVALLTTIGLSSKNAILIVEFAESAVDEGYSLSRAAIRAAQTRLRPIVMTSLAFILGVMPLVISTGAGSGAQNAVGTGVMGGMVTATVLAIFFVPVFFVVVRRRFSRKNEDIEHSHTVDHH